MCFISNMKNGIGNHYDRVFSSSETYDSIGAIDNAPADNISAARITKKNIKKPIGPYKYYKRVPLTEDVYFPTDFKTPYIDAPDPAPMGFASLAAPPETVALSQVLILFQEQKSAVSEWIWPDTYFDTDNDESIPLLDSSFTEIESANFYNENIYPNASARRHALTPKLVPTGEEFRRMEEYQNIIANGFAFNRSQIRMVDEDGVYQINLQTNFAYHDEVEKLEQQGDLSLSQVLAQVVKKGMGYSLNSLTVIYNEFRSRNASFTALVPLDQFILMASSMSHDHEAEFVREEASYEVEDGEDYEMGNIFSYGNQALVLA
ncbi:MAG: hypothetical protein JWM96_956 [Alphaproteobacteria bacterium]|nr:hypothetical protein [Alphaproteobacteria bacterium]